MDRIEKELMAMGRVLELIEDVRKQTEADERALRVARTRRNAVAEIVRRHPGVRRTYHAGSLAAGVVIHEVSDADGGCVLDRRCYPDLGPDGDGDPPRDVVRELHELLGPDLRRTWPGARVHGMKRGLRVFFHDPLPDGQDPYVDFVVAMDRKDTRGLWIPNMKLNRWDAADPEAHVDLLTSGTRELRRTRARAVRLAKAWNGQWTEPGLCSFNLCALALETFRKPTSLDVAMLDFFTHAVSSLEDHLTPDPAGVSGPIRLLLPKDVVLQRLRAARDALTQAMDGTDVDQALHNVFWKFLPEPVAAYGKDDVAALLRVSTPRLRAAAGGLTVAGAAKHPRAFGGAFHG